MLNRVFAFLSMVILMAVWAGFAPTRAYGVEKRAVTKEKTQQKAPHPTHEESASGKKAQGNAPHGAAKGGSDLSPGQVNARAGVLVEVSTGTFLTEQNADEIIEPASFTKILSLYLIFEALQQGRIHLTDEVWISETAWRTGGSKMFVGVGTKVPLEELIKGIAVVSGNDACVAAAEHLHGSLDAFVEAMNHKARELGMTQSHFMNPHGLPADGQVTTARDMATLDLAYLQHFPESLKYHSMREYTYNNITQGNRNHLLFKDESVDGLKTGFVAAGGYHLSATAKRDGMRLLAVVMGAANPGTREREAMKLLNYGYRQYALVQPFPAGQPAATVKVWKGVRDEVALYPAQNATFLIPQSQKHLLKWDVSVPEEVAAPVEPQQPVGEMVFTVSDQPRKTVALVSYETVPRAGWFKRMWQTVLRVHKIDWRWISGISGGLFVLLVLFFLIGNLRSRGSRRSKTFGS